MGSECYWDFPLLLLLLLVEHYMVVVIVIVIIHIQIMSGMVLDPKQLLKTMSNKV